MQRGFFKKVSSMMCIVIIFMTLANATVSYATSQLGSKFYEKEFLLAPGVTLKQNNYETKNKTRRAVNYLTVDLNEPSASLQIAFGQPLNQMNRVTDLAVRETTLGSKHVVGAVNASFFLTNGSNLPVGLVTRNNEILRLGSLSSSRNDPISYRYAFGINKHGKPQISSYQERFTLHINGKTFPISSYNSVRQPNQIILFTPSLSYPVPSIDNPFSTEIIVENASKNTQSLSFGDEITGTVRSVSRNNHGTKPQVPKDGFILAANGEALMKQLENIKAGDDVKVTIAIDEKWMDAESIISTGPLLVSNGKVSISMNESSSFARTAHPRTAVGITRNNELLLVTVDGRQDGYSNGISLRDLAQYMISLGAVEAINLDGGASTTLVARLAGHDYAHLINRPSSGSEIRVSNALQIISTEPTRTVTKTHSVIDTFENVSNWQARSVLAHAQISLSNDAKKAVSGKNSVKLTYDFIANREKNKGTAAAYIAAKQPILLDGKPVKIGVWVHGDENENWLRLQVRDRNNQSHVLNFTGDNGLNWFGWRYVTAEVPSSLKTPMSIERIYIAQTTEAKKARGALYFDQLEAIYDKDFTEPTEQYPNIIDTRFPDVRQDHWAIREINYLANQGVINGLPNGRFSPTGNITREQVALMLVRQLQLNTKNRKPVHFHDVDKSNYAYDAIMTVYEEGLLTGRRAGYFDPKQPLTRAEAATILNRAYKLTGNTSSTFPDTTDNWAKEAISILVDNNVTTGYTDGTFKPNKNVSRAEFSAFIYRIVKK